MKKKLIIFGAGETAEMAAELFTCDSREKVYGFVVDNNFWKPNQEKCGLPVFRLNTVVEEFPPEKYNIFVALGSGRLNRDRKRFYNFFKKKSYNLISYVSSKANLWRTTEIGDNCMIFEGNNLQHNVKIGNNNILWSYNHVGHGSVIEESCFLSSNICVAGYSKVKKNCFLGINSSVIDNITIETDCFIAAGAVVNKNTKENSIYSGNPAKRNIKISAKKFCKVKNEDT